MALGEEGNGKRKREGYGLYLGRRRALGGGNGIGGGPELGVLALVPIGCLPGEERNHGDERSKKVVAIWPIGHRMR